MACWIPSPFNHSCQFQCLQKTSRWRWRVQSFILKWTSFNANKLSFDSVVTKVCLILCWCWRVQLFYLELNIIQCKHDVLWVVWTCVQNQTSNRVILIWTRTLSIKDLFISFNGNSIERFVVYILVPGLCSWVTLDLSSEVTMGYHVLPIRRPHCPSHVEECHSDMTT